MTTKKVVVAYSPWAYYRPGKGMFVTTDIDPTLMTNLNYLFFGLSEKNEIKVLNPEVDIDLKFIEKTIALKKKNPNLKVLAAVGGWNEGSSKYSKMAADKNKRSVFIKSVTDFFKKHGFDGLDLNWMSPGQHGGSSNDRDNYILLLKELKAALKPLGKLFSVSVVAAQSSAALSYDIPKMVEHVDYINLATYDFHGPFDNQLGHNASLLDTRASVDYWLSQGAPAGKLIVGIPFYGRSFTLVDRSQTTVGCPHAGPGRGGPYTREPGILGYNEICEMSLVLKSQWDEAASVPSAYSDDQWISYENEKSIIKKVSFVTDRKLGGAMAWCIDHDDFHGIKGKKYALLQTINHYIKQ